MDNTANNSAARKKKAQLNAEYLTQQLTQFAQQHNITNWVLAYSGGVDSQVLLHLLSLTGLNISAVYIDHGLQTQSADWAEHCRQQCLQFNIPFQIIKVNGAAAKGESPEAAARLVRYAALKNLIQKDAGLLTAQHQDDQAETVLLQLLRGAGAAGLAGMPTITKFAQAWHARPLLNVSKKTILDYAQVNNLNWVEDPSNQHVNFDRNYLRHNIIPNMLQRWPALNKTLGVFSQQQAENSRLLDELAELDLSTVELEKNCLNINLLNKLSDARLRNVLRYWLKIIESPAKNLVPSRAVLEQIVMQIKTPSHDTAALVSWAKCEVRRFRNKLYWLKKTQHDASKVYCWDAKDVLVLDSIGKKLSLNKVNTDEKNIAFVLKADILKKSVSIQFRQGGEKIKPAGRNGSHDLKSLFQEASVPTWQRDKIPLLFVGNELVAVIGFWLADSYAIKGEGVLPVLNDAS